MGVDTRIEWTNRSWSPWQGCTKVAAGCKHCYAEGIVHRFKGKGNRGRVFWGPRGSRLGQSEKYWGDPVRWNRTAEKRGATVRVFPSMCDPFEASMPVVSRDGVPEEFRTGDLRARFFSMIEATPWLTWLVLTKRPENILELVPGRWKDPGGAWPRNLWTGTSVATQGDADRNVPLLLAVPGKHFVSYEPALGWMNLEPWLADLDWIICGGESGPEARVCQVTWLCKVVDHCLALGVPVFVKQLGSNAEYLDRCMGLKDPKGGDMSEWPGGLRVRALPEFWAAGDLHHEGHEAHEGVEGGAVDVRG